MRFFYFNFQNLSLSFGVPGSGSVFQIRIWIQGGSSDPKNADPEPKPCLYHCSGSLRNISILDQDKFVSEPNQLLSLNNKGKGVDIFVNLTEVITT